MIRERFLGIGGRLRPFMIGGISIPSQNVSGEVNFLVDTGADSTLLVPPDALRLNLDVARLPEGPPVTGVGGLTRTVYTEAAIAFGHLAYQLPLRILAPVDDEQARSLRRIPSLLGRDILSHFAVFIEERTSRVLLLEPNEADSLPLL